VEFGRGVEGESSLTGDLWWRGGGVLMVWWGGGALIEGGSER